MKFREEPEASAEETLTNLSHAAVALIEQAQQALSAAYAVYSHYRVGAACLWSSGRLTWGGNIENASYGLTICAERVALFTGIAQGERHPQALAVAVETAEFAVPCGACLQVMAEWAQELPVYLTNKNGEVRITHLRQLLPQVFAVGIPHGVAEKSEVDSSPEVSPESSRIRKG